MAGMAHQQIRDHVIAGGLAPGGCRTRIERAHQADDVVQLVIVKAQAALEQLAIIVAQCLEELTYQAACLRQQRQIIRQQRQL